MAIVRPEKPVMNRVPEIDAIIRNAMAGTTGSGAPATTVRPQARPDPATMPIEVMTDAPMQPQQPGGGSAMPVTPAMPVDPAVPQLNGGGGATDGGTTVVIVEDDPASAPIDDPLDLQSKDEAGNGAVGAAAAGALTGAALAAALGMRKGKAGRDGNAIVRHNEDVLDSALQNGEITPEQAATVDPNTGDAAQPIDKISEGADGNQRQRGSQGRSAGRRATRNSNTADPQPTAPDVATDAPDRPAAGPVGDEPISTDDVMGARNVTASIDTSSLPEGTRVVDVNPRLEGRFISAGTTGVEGMPSDAVINVETKELVIPTGDGRWLVMPAGSTNETVRYDNLRKAQKALRAVMR